MKIRSVELINFRKFVGTVRVEAIGDNVNVLVGRNELGKSTLLQAINAAIFERARSTASHVKAFRHFVNGTVPEVKLAFEANGKTWTIHKRFAGQAGKAVLTCSDGKIAEDEAAETELQRILGFTGGRGGGEPGIWGTLWVQQGQSFTDAGLNEQAQRTIQGCLEAQVGLVTGGARGQKIPKAVREALAAIQSQKGPRGRFKEVAEQLVGLGIELTELEGRAKAVSELLVDLARNRRELKEAQSGWNEADHQAELEAERNKRMAAATLAAELASARDAANLARERAENARVTFEDRTAAIKDLEALESKYALLEPDAESASSAKDHAKAAVELAEQAISELRAQMRDNSDLSRRLERIRNLVALESERVRHEATLDESVSLDAEAARLSELIGSISATDEAVLRIEEAVTACAAADAASSAVATNVSFNIEKQALGKVLVDGVPLGDDIGPIAVLTKTVIAIDNIGTIALEPQIKDRAALLRRQQAADDALKVRLEESGASDLAQARAAAAQRREHVRSLAQVKRDISELAPANPQKKLASGLEALKAHVGELRGRIKSEQEALQLSELPDAETVSAEITKTHDDGARVASEISHAEAALAGPRDSLAQADRQLRKCEDQGVELRGLIGKAEADLDAARASLSDAALEQSIAQYEGIAVAKENVCAEKEKTQGESVEATDARIKRLESAAVNHRRSVTALDNEVTRLTALIQAKEGEGIEELVLERQAERERLQAVVTEFEQEVAVLQLLLDTLLDAESEAKTRYLAPVVERVQPYLKMLLPDAQIVLGEDLQISGIQRDGQTEAYEVLSGGTQEQLAVLTRIAFAELLLGQNRPATVILDDALAFSDDDRIESMFDVLMRAGENVQIIVLTCRRKLFTRLGAEPLSINKVN